MKLKIVNRKKFIKSIALMLGILFIIIFIVSNKSLSHAELKYSCIFVTQGDTLWSIAEEQQCNNPYYNGKDVRYIIASIKNLNNLTNSYLMEGQELIIASM